jgi:hypothetical protein
MATRTRTTTIHSYNPRLDARADQVCRWSAYGSRAYTGIQGKSVHTPVRPFIDKRPLIWFGGDGLKAGFTVSNVGSILDGRPYRRSITGNTLSFYRRNLKNISIISACQILERLGCADDTFYRACHPESKRYTRCTPAKIVAAEGWYKGCGWLCAALNPATRLRTIEFLGGPPSRWGVQKGSLFTLTMDRIAVVILLGGLAADAHLHLEDYFPRRA